jgi:dimethylamine---corrinoid protein Co-methyltransferase
VGTGDVLGLSIGHILASSMGGIRTAGDLVAWMQMTRKMKISDAKKYVAHKLKVQVEDLTDEEKMRDIREALDIGTVVAISGSAKGITAKCKIAKLLEIEINSVNLFKSKMAGFME